MKTLFASFCLLFSFFSSCQQRGGNFETLGGNFETLSVEDFVNVINDPEVQRLDVRTVAEYSEGHIPGSMNVNVLDESFAAVADSVLQLSRPVALYCRSGKRSKKAAHILSEKGFKVYELETGFNGWVEAGQQVEK